MGSQGRYPILILEKNQEFRTLNQVQIYLEVDQERLYLVKEKKS